MNSLKPTKPLIPTRVVVKYELVWVVSKATPATITNSEMNRV